ncbi:MAG: ArsA family ATPase [Spirochaetaceae bacterium]|nr:MAG: ArsA family ATPase [Spirochaetaceae bacterium]
MKTIFFTGKGGVGKSSLSATCAWQLSEKGYKTLLVSLDPAHNVADIFETEVGHKKSKFSTNLFLQEANLDKAASTYIEQNIDILTQVYSYTRAFNFDMYFKVLRYSPGVEEYASLTILEEILRKETDLDYVVFDTPPTGLTLRILALPNISITWVDRLRRIRRQILEKRHTIHNITGKYSEEGFRLAYNEKDDAVMQKLNEIWQRYVNVYKALKGESNSIAVVFNPDYLSLKESQRIIVGLKDLNLPLRAGFNNKYEERLKDNAERVERELFGEKPDGSVRVKRVPLDPSGRRDAYRMDFDVVDAVL